MADADTQTPDATTFDPALLNQLLQRSLQDTPPPVRDTTPTKRSWTSLLGEALAGPVMIPGATDAEKELYGKRALSDFGTALLSAPPGSYMGGTFGTVLGRGLQGAERGQLGAEQMTAANLGAQQDYQLTQQELRLKQIKEALPLLSLAQQAAVTRNMPNPLAPTAARPSTSIGTAGTAAGGGVGAAGTYEAAVGTHEGTGANPNSTALGAGQFLASTWQDFAKANPDLFKGMTPEQVLAARTNTELGTKAITWLAQQNADALTKSGVTPSGPALGIAHYLGAGAAAKVMQAPDNAPVSGFVSAAAVKANPELATMTAGQMRQRYANTPAPAFLGGPQPGGTASNGPLNGPLVNPRTGTNAVTLTPGGTPGTADAPARTPPAATPGVTMGDAARPGDVPPPPGAPAGAYPAMGGGIGAVLGPARENVGGEQYGAAPPPVIKAAPIPASRTGTNAGRVAGDVGAIEAGMQLAQATPTPGTQGAGPAAGPSGGVPAAPVPQGFGSKVGTYDFGGPPAAAPGQPPPVGSTPAAQQPPPPPGRMTFEQFQAQHPLTIDPATYTVPPPDVSDFRAAQQRAAQAVTVARAKGDLAGENAAGVAYDTAGQHIIEAQQAAITKSAELRQKALEAQQNHQRQLYQEEMKNQLSEQQKLQDQAFEERKIQLQAENTRLSSAQAADIARQEKRMEALDTEAGTARNGLNDLDMFRALSNSVGTASPWTQISVGGKRIADWITQFQLGSPEYMAQLGNQQAYEAVANKIIGGLRAGQSMGNLSDRDLDFIKAQAPTLMQNPQTRGNIIGFLEQAYQRKLDFARTVAKYYKPGVVSVAEASEKADAELGPILKKVPAFADLTDDAQHKAQTLWLYNNIQPGTFFKDRAGKLRPYNPPENWKPEGAE